MFLAISFCTRTKKMIAATQQKKWWNFWSR
ncbi:DUF3967 domain-containing protein [Ectobacillus funiculus]|uniref:DUF3967 domain-containing protein n=1 Tax=Ectobacillus funiculus TaxID=137993 RepID=A0ABV5WED9_9BACI